MIEVVDDSDKVGADVVLLHGCPQSCLPNPIESLLEIYGDMVEVLLVLKIFLTEDSWVDYLLGGAPPCSEACLFFSNDFLRLRLQSVLYDLSITAYEADRSVVLALLQVAFLGKCDDYGTEYCSEPYNHKA